MELTLETKLQNCLCLFKQLSHLCCLGHNGQGVVQAQPKCQQKPCLNNISGKNVPSAFHDPPIGLLFQVSSSQNIAPHQLVAEHRIGCDHAEEAKTALTRWLFLFEPRNDWMKPASNFKLSEQYSIISRKRSIKNSNQWRICKKTAALRLNPAWSDLPAVAN